MPGKLLTLLILGAAVLATVGVARASHDHMFDVSGVVTTEDGAPLKDAEVTLQVNGPVFEAVMVVRTVKRSTDGTGGFVFRVHQAQTEREVHAHGAQRRLRTSNCFGQRSPGGTPHASHEESWRLTTTE